MVGLGSIGAVIDTIQSGPGVDSGDGVSLAVLLFAGTALLLLIALVVVILLIVTRRLGHRRPDGGDDEGEPIADAWDESAKRTEPFE
jgi:hypothetical protein